MTKQSNPWWLIQNVPTKFETFPMFKAFHCPYYAEFIPVTIQLCLLVMGTNGYKEVGEGV